jgi:hypothetical protein
MGDWPPYPLPMPFMFPIPGSQAMTSCISANPLNSISFGKIYLKLSQHCRVSALRMIVFSLNSMYSYQINVFF